MVKGAKNRKVAEAIRDFVLKHGLAQDMRIYFNGICWNFDSYGKMTILKDIKGSEYTEYANDSTVTVTTEGELYDVINMYPGNTALCDEFEAIISSFDAFFELGHSWDFSVYYNK